MSLGIETTGLDPDKHQILEIAAVCDDLAGETWSTDIFHVYVKHKEIVGQPTALVMNAKIIRMIEADKCEDDAVITRELSVTRHFREWLRKHHLDSTRVTFAGKNVANFDLRFMRNLPGWVVHVREHHRTIDPGILYLRADDKEVPRLNECLHRAGLSVTGDHRALDDALAVVRLVRQYFDLQPKSTGFLITPDNYGL